jgi:CRISPR-associated protein Cmr2
LNWRRILKECRSWIERKIPDNYQWERDWELWGAHTWEVFHGQGDSITAAMNDLEANKLCRAWVGVNWIGESSSLSGSDAIAWPGMGAKSRNPKTLRPGVEDKNIGEFYIQLQEKLGEGFLDASERLSIPELVKRLVTLDDLVKRLVTLDDLGKESKSIKALQLDKNFSDIRRKPDPAQGIPGQWTAWFMGDGDKVGDHLKALAKEDDDAIAAQSQQIQDAQKPKDSPPKDEPGTRVQYFSSKISQWSQTFDQNFKTKQEQRELGRLIYAGGDDFLGVLYDWSPYIINASSSWYAERKARLQLNALQWLMGLQKEWREHGLKYTQKTGHKKVGDHIGLSVGFVWAGHSVPQRDVLQHCREAETQAKNAGRDRVALRVLFNNGQHVQWITPWDWLPVLTQYRDRQGGNNWAHIYGDWADLKARHAVEPHQNSPRNPTELDIALAIFEYYFRYPNQPETLENLADLLPEADQLESAIVDWINDLIEIGWHLCNKLDF